MDRLRPSSPVLPGALTVPVRPGSTSPPFLQPPTQLFTPAGPTLPKAGLSAPSFAFLEGSQGIVAGAGASATALRAARAMPGVQAGWVGRLEHNRHSGNDQEAAILVPQGLDYRRPVQVMYYFHGWNGAVSKALASGSEGLGDVLMDWGRRHNAVVVVPQGPARDVFSHQPSWMKGPGQFDHLNREVLGHLTTLLPAQAQLQSVALAGHSAGGLAVKNSLESLSGSGMTSLQGGRWSSLQVAGATFLDATYSDEAGVGSSRANHAHRALKALNPQATFEVLYLTGTATDKGYTQTGQTSYLETTDTRFQAFAPHKLSHGAVPRHFFARP